MPSRTVKHQHGVGMAPQMLREAIKVRFQISVCVAAGGADEGEEIDPFVFGLSEGAGTTAAVGPDSGQRALSAAAGFFLEPLFDSLVPLLEHDALERFGECFF